MPRLSRISRLRPTAAISYEIAYGDTVQLSGYGTDEDGEVVAYRWRSNLDGELSRSATFETDSLSVGDHVLYFTVQDNTGAWSDAALQSVKVLPPAAIPPTIHSFTASQSTVRTGESATLLWDVSGATSVVISRKIGTVPASGSKVVTPDGTTTYTLTATGSGSAVATASVTITLDPPHVAILAPSTDV